MGLDMYACTAPSDAITRDVDFDTKALPDISELHYWRKHPNLHGWMEDLYYAKGGKEQFNCVPVRLSLDDLTQLELAITSGSLPSTSGFFFGQSDGSESSDDLAFVAKAREAIEAGRTVYYDSWW
ncbi:MAG: hypothetical protein R3D99_00080 [Altererythrobacter sp.]